MMAELGGMVAVSRGAGRVLGLVVEPLGWWQTVGIRAASRGGDRALRLMSVSRDGDRALGLVAVSRGGGRALGVVQGVRAGSVGSRHLRRVWSREVPPVRGEKGGAEGKGGCGAHPRGCSAPCRPRRAATTAVLSAVLSAVRC